MGDDREAGRGDQRHEEHRERGHDEHHDRGDHVFADVAASRHDPPLRTRWAERGDSFVVGIDEHGHRLRLRQCRRGQQHEVFVEIVRVLDDADDGPLDSIEGDRRADGGTDQVRDRLRHCRLGVVDRIPAAVQAEHRPPERSVRVLRSVVHRLLGARHRHVPVSDRIDRSEPFGPCVELGSALPTDRCCRTGRSAWRHRTRRSPTPARRCRPPTRTRPTQPPTPSGGPRSGDADASRGGRVATTT